MTNKSCSIFYETLIAKKFKILKKQDPIYFYKSIKNKIEIKNMIQSHIFDGAALTKFLYWIKKINKKRLQNLRHKKSLRVLENKIRIIYFQVLILSLALVQMVR